MSQCPELIDTESNYSDLSKDNQYSESHCSEDNTDISSQQSLFEIQDKMINIETPIILNPPIIKSHFHSNLDVLYFPMPNEHLEPLKDSIAKRLVWKISRKGPRVVRELLQQVGFSMVSKGNNFIGYWGKHMKSTRYKKHQNQYINHFPAAFELGRKDKMWWNYCDLKLKFRSEYSFCPETFVLPKEISYFNQNIQKYRQWIIKPCASARGIGIKVISAKEKLDIRKPVVCCRYIDNPLLINKRKFDLRLYVLVTSFDPIRIYLYNHGIVRFASADYNRKSESKFSNLTNYSVSKRSKHQQNLQDPFGIGSQFSMANFKWSLSTLGLYFQSQGWDYDALMAQIHSLIIKSMATVHQKHIIAQRTYLNDSLKCYELFGYDVLIDSEFKAWLMEVNISPALKGSCDMDYSLKRMLIRDTFNTVGFRLSDIEPKKKVPVAKVPRKILGSSNDLSETDLNILAEFEDEVNFY